MKCSIFSFTFSLLAVGTAVGGDAPRSPANQSLAEQAVNSAHPHIRAYIKTSFTEVFFFTNRRLDEHAFMIGGSKDFDRLLGNKSSPLTPYGVMTVEYPAHRQVSEMDRADSNSEENPLKFFSTTSLIMYFSPYEFSAELRNRFPLPAENNSASQPAIYIHGLNNSFTYAIESAAQLQADLKRTPIILFSWPSDPGIFRPDYNYQAALDQVSVASPHLSKVVALVNDTFKRPPDFILHSLGANLMLDAYSKIKTGEFTPSLKIHNAVFAAPDLSTDLFLEHRNWLSVFWNRYTIYCTDDYALRLSRMKNQNERLGYCPENFQVDRSLPIIVVRGRMLDLLRHSYFLSAPKMISEMTRALSDQTMGSPGVAFAPSRIDLP